MNTSAPVIPQAQQDVEVIDVAMLDDEFAANYAKPWLCREENGTIHPFETEEAACAWQREWRMQHGRDPATGELPQFKLGDIVCWTNDYGVKWHGRRVVEVGTPDRLGHRYYLEPNDAHWMYVREKNLALETMNLAELQARLPYDGGLARFCAKVPGYLESIAN